MANRSLSARYLSYRVHCPSFSDPIDPQQTDYFRRLGLLCAKCGQALRAGYITSSGKGPVSSRVHEVKH